MMLNELLRALKRFLWAAGLLLGLFLAAEFARVFILLYRINPLAGFAFAGLLAAAGIVLLTAGLLSARAPEPLARPDFLSADHHALVRYCQSLSRRLIYLGSNRFLSREARREAADAVGYIRDLLRAHPLRDDLIRAIETTENERLPALLAPLNAAAAQAIESAAAQALREAYASSPVDMRSWRLLSRQIELAARITDIYSNASRLRDRLGHIRDALKLCAQRDNAGWLHRFQSHLASHRSLPRQALLDIPRWLGLGWALWQTGQAAADRCQHPGVWTPEEASARLDAQAGEAAVFLKAFFNSRILGDVKYLLRPDPLPESFDDSSYGGMASHAVKVAIDATLSAPVQEARAQAAPAPARLETAPAFQELEEPVIRKHHNHHRRRAPAFIRIAITFGQRIKYGFLSRRLYR